MRSATLLLSGLTVCAPGNPPSVDAGGEAPPAHAAKSDGTGTAPGDAKDSPPPVTKGDADSAAPPSELDRALAVVAARAPGAPLRELPRLVKLADCRAAPDALAAAEREALTSSIEDYAASADEKAAVAMGAFAAIGQAFRSRSTRPRHGRSREFC